MTENRVLKFNDSNQQRQKELSKQYSAKNKKGKSMRCCAPYGATLGGQCVHSFWSICLIQVE